MDIDQIRRWESRLEGFVSEHLDLISPNLTIVKRQRILDDTRKRRIGVIDIFAQGDDGHHALLECKVTSLTSRDLGQCLGYWGYWYDRCKRMNLPNPIVYCIGPAVDPIYEYGARAISDLPIVKTFIYKFPLGYGPEDDEWNVEISQFDENYHLLKMKN